MKYNHMLDIAFSVETTEPDPLKLPRDEVLAALMQRIAGLLSDGQLIAEISHCDTYTIEEDE